MIKILFAFLLLTVGASAQTYPARGLDYNQLPGSTISASSELSGYSAASAFQGDRIGQNCAFVVAANRCWGRVGNEAGWADNTPGVFPDTLQNVWAGPHSVSRFVVVSFQDNYSTPRKEPYFNLRVGADYTIEDFDIQILTLQNSWFTVATVTENYDVLREINIDAVTAKGSRIVVNGSHLAYSTVISFEAYGK